MKRLFCPGGASLSQQNCDWEQGLAEMFPAATGLSSGTTVLVAWSFLNTPDCTESSTPHFLIHPFLWASPLIWGNKGQAGKPSPVHETPDLPSAMLTHVSPSTWVLLPFQGCKRDQDYFRKKPEESSTKRLLLIPNEVNEVKRTLWAPLAPGRWNISHCPSIVLSGYHSVASFFLSLYSVTPLLTGTELFFLVSTFAGAKHLPVGAKRRLTRDFFSRMKNPASLATPP